MYSLQNQSCTSLDFSFQAVLSVMEFPGVRTATTISTAMASSNPQNNGSTCPSPKASCTSP
jgi:hypothetical protein